METKRSHLGALLAAGSLFTRLPFWRLRELTREDYEDALSWWPVIGLVTGGVLAGSFCLYSLVLPPEVALVLALVSRLFLTGGFHEDGLGDFFDGFGGGRTKEQILSIMKDSHVGSYAVLAFVLHYLLYWSSASSIPGDHLPLVLLACDVTGKCSSLLQVQLLPYARRTEECKVGVVYRQVSWLPLLLGISLLITTQGLAFSWLFVEHFYIVLPFALPLLTSLGLIFYLRKRIGGYTGDTCGALCLLCELAALLSYTIFAHMITVY